ncbi:hypothetical protein GCM10011614_15660 [Novosphingobium colocasiae]|uniref:Uncharacterized protein n=1 Tax=Novosphingobium colocasiae TaxID=1256513 RepID=A0A918PDG3_9SPHN|nr:hypothetical protein GCM10011614_15660 [Novosphingobium colocasiae]
MADRRQYLLLDKARQRGIDLEPGTFNRIGHFSSHTFTVRHHDGVPSRDATILSDNALGKEATL